MKKLIIAALAVAAATTMYAQGTVYVDGTVSMVSKNAVTYGLSCGDLAGAKIGDNFIGTLLYEGQPIASQAFNGVNSKTGEFTGKMNGSIVTISGVFLDLAPKTFTVHAEDTTGLYKGDSLPFTYSLGNPNAEPPTTPEGKLTYESFTVDTAVPEPTTIALGILGLSSLLVFRRRD